MSSQQYVLLKNGLHLIIIWFNYRTQPPNVLDCDNAEQRGWDSTPSLGRRSRQRAEWAGQWMRRWMKVVPWCDPRSRSRHSSPCRRRGRGCGTKLSKSLTKNKTWLKGPNRIVWTTAGIWIADFHKSAIQMPGSLLWTRQENSREIVCFSDHHLNNWLK